MNGSQSEDDRLVLYLLGEPLSESEQNEIEERYFTDNAYFNRVLALEEDLIESHVRGTLTEREKGQFESHFLSSTRHREKWEAQRAIAAFFRSRAHPVGFLSGCARLFQSLAPGHRLVAAAAVVVVVAGISVLAGQYVRLVRRHTELQARASKVEVRPAAIAAMATFSLSPNRLRSDVGTHIQIPANVQWIVLRAELPSFVSSRQSLAGILSTAEGEELWRQNRLTAENSAIAISLPASSLKYGDYILLLTALDGSRQVPLPSYQFRIDR